MTSIDDLIPVVGQRVGPYRLERVLGRGGFGVVYKAIKEGVELEVALKLMTPRLSSGAGSSQWLARFEQEASILKRLHHPATIRLLDHGATEHGLPYIVMEFARGESLGRRIAQGPMAPEQVLRIANQVLGALEEAHGAGVVHRDLKPDNIMLLHVVGADDAVKVLDFGIAKLLDPGGAVQTQAGVTVGTPRYMAPEQINAFRRVDGRADLYATALIMAECLTGIPVVTGQNDREIVSAQVRETPHALDPRLTQLPFCSVLQKALAKDRDDRFASARDMRHALRAAATHPAVTPVRGAVAMEAAGPTVPVQSVQSAPPPQAARPTPRETHPLNRGERSSGRLPILPFLFFGLAVAIALVVIVVISAGDEGPEPTQSIADEPDAGAEEARDAGTSTADTTRVQTPTTDVRRDRGTTTVRPDLTRTEPPVRAGLSVRGVDPPDASVWVAGRRIGQGSGNYQDLEPGEAQVILRAPGYIDLVTTVTLRPDATTTIAGLVLEAEPPPLTIGPLAARLPALPAVASAAPSAEATAMNSQGFDAYRDGNLEEAAGHYEHAVRLEPGYHLARFNLACAWALLDRREDALSVLQSFANAPDPRYLRHVLRARVDADWTALWGDPDLGRIVLAACERVDGAVGALDAQAATELSQLAGRVCRSD